ncbi:MAG: dihydroorotate dehydrogenase [Acidobacteriota bacterium]|jgi:dihydroorotate dehydrogenase (NAD+) catalytic subunit|nr:dihydroorotate dehydrogenase [Acidobacteriota bacterium]
MADLSVDLGFRVLKSPLITASGTFGYGEEFLPFYDLDILGAIVMKGIFRDPRPGNPPPRLHETPAGLLNSIGLAGPGSAALQEIIRRLHARTAVPIIVNVCGEDDEEFAEVAALFSAMDEVAMLELNISCPNVRQGGACPAQDAGHTARLVRQVKDRVRKPLIVKLSPNAVDIVAVAQAAQDSGADALSLVNTFLGMAVDITTRRPVFANVYAGLSGPAIKPLALRLVREVCRRAYVPVIGMGGIASGHDVLEYFLVGAAAVQIGTINFREPAAALRITGEIEAEMERLKIKSLSEIRGQLQA